MQIVARRYGTSCMDVGFISGVQWQRLLRHKPDGMPLHSDETARFGSTVESVAPMPLRQQRQCQFPQWRKPGTLPIYSGKHDGPECRGHANKATISDQFPL